MALNGCTATAAGYTGIAVVTYTQVNREAVRQTTMIGAIAGDIIGSTFEGRPIKTTEFPLFAPHSVFTDDTVLTVAVADTVLNDLDYAVVLRAYARRYPNAGYGNSFYVWMLSDEEGPYNSWGNGSAMRVSPIGFAFDTESEVLAEALRSAEVTHNHPEGIKGAQATALAVFLGRTTHDKTLIREEITQRFDYDLDRSLEDIRATYQFDLSCQRSVPNQSSPFLSQTTSRMRYAKRFPWAEMATRWPASPAALHRLITMKYRLILSMNCEDDYRPDLFPLSIASTGVTT